MRAGSLFSGVGGFDLGMHRAGIEVVFQCEQDPYRREVLARHWPASLRLGDVRTIERYREPRADPAWWELRDAELRARGDFLRHPDSWRRRKRRAYSRAVLCRAAHEGERDWRRYIGPWEAQGGRLQPGDLDLLFGGFPCQDLSVAGRRAGFAGERSSLFFEFARIADALLGDGGWLLIENVPGLLSSHGGRDFAILLATLAELGFHDLAWRVLDSRHFGVPQRRRRVFVLARRARGGRARKVLLEPESGGGDFETGREARARVAADSGISPALTRRYGKGTDSDASDAFVGTLGTGPASGGHRIGADEAAGGQLVVNALDRKGGGADDNDAQAGHLVAHTLRSEGFDASEDGTGRGTPLVADGVRATPRTARRVDVGAVSIHPDAIGRDGIAKTPSEDGASYTLNTGAPPGVFAGTYGSDRCAVDPQPDGRRYAACGDAVSVPVSEWIGRRLMAHGGD